MNERDDDTAEAENARPGSLEEGCDYYLENGLMVFTGEFLKRRGYCCESSCRHCPYGFNENAKE